MSSGFATPAGYITDVQDTYDFVVEEVGCSNATDTLACLRTVPADNLLAAANATPPIGSYPVRPYMSDFTKAYTDLKSYKGSLLRIPATCGWTVCSLTTSTAFSQSSDGGRTYHNWSAPQYSTNTIFLSLTATVTGDCKDEATLFSFASTNVTWVAHSFPSVLDTDSKRAAPMMNLLAISPNSGSRAHLPRTSAGRCNSIPLILRQDLRQCQRVLTAVQACCCSPRGLVLPRTSSTAAGQRLCQAASVQLPYVSLILTSPAINADRHSER